MRLLIHVCCADCLARTLAGLRAGGRGVVLLSPDGPREESSRRETGAAEAADAAHAAHAEELQVAGFFFNPNIHPLLEFRRRLKSVRVLLERVPVDVECDETYGLADFCRAVHPDYGVPARCRPCYALRLGRTAERAAARGFDAITTTLVTSRHQDHGLIRSVGKAQAAACNVAFCYQDLRAAEAPDELVRGLYRQQYCGCVFSEADRYVSTSKHLYRPQASKP